MIYLPDFLVIPYPLLEDKEIGLVDERLYGIIYWFSKMKNEKCTASNKTLAELVKTTPVTISNSLTKLEEKGYIKRIFKDDISKHRKEIIPLVVFAKVSPTSESLSPTSESPLSLTDEQNKNILNKNSKRDTSKAVALQVSNEVPLVIEAFITVNQACKDFYGNTTQRKYVEKLISAYGFDKVMKVVGFLPKANNKLYNKATTPKELWDKWAKIEAEATQLRDGKKPNKYQVTKIY